LSIHIRSKGTDGRGSAAEQYARTQRGRPLAHPRQVGNTIPAPRFYRGAIVLHPNAWQPIAPGFSGFGCEAIAPVTHQDLAIGQVRQTTLAACAAPEKRWYRYVSNLITVRVVAAFRPQPLLAHASGDCSSYTGGGNRRPIRPSGFSPTPLLANLCRLDHHAKQRFSSNSVRSFSM
jgi:hypothetical protein